MRSLGLARVCLALVAVQLPVAVVAAVAYDDGDAVIVDSGFLAEAAGRTEVVDRLRYEMTITIGSPELLDIADVVVMTGSQAGALSQFTMDQSALLEAAGATGVEGMTMEMVQDTTVAYLRSPMFAATAAAGGAVAPAMQPLVDLADRWGRIDLVAVQASGSAIASDAFGSTALDLPSAMALVRDAAGPAEEGGTDVLRGVPVTLYEADITFGESSGSSGVDMQSFTQFMPEVGSGDGPDLAAVFAAMEDLPLEFEVAVDDGGLVRRVTYAFDEGFIEALAEEFGDPVGDAADIRFETSIELFDFGDPSIVVELPVIEDPVDLTPWAISLGGQID